MAKKTVLKINEEENNNGQLPIRISSRAQQNGLKIRPFRFLENNSDQNSDHMARLKKYKDPKIYRGDRRRWVEYWYRIPAELKHIYPGKTWHKFRVFEDINRIKTEEYAQLLLDGVIYKLENGFDPFEHAKAAMAGIVGQLDPVKKVWTITQALSFFVDKWGMRGNEADTLRAYTGPIKLLQQWLTTRNLQNRLVTDLEPKLIENFFDDVSRKRGWSNRTFNNNVLLLRTVCTFLVKKKLLADNPVGDITLKRSKSEKHRYYDPVRFKLIREVMEKKDPLIFFAAKLIYYLCIRSNKELRAFKVEDIFLDRRQVRVKAENAKTDTTRYIAIPEELYPELAEIWEKNNGNYYVIGAPPAGKKWQAKNKPGPAPFGKNFLGERFAEIRKAAALDDSFTLYGLKHTRIIHLKQDGGKDSDIIQLTGHTSYEAYSGYLRDLGIDGNPDAINKISRKF